jgi:hypothetical protein
MRRSCARSRHLSSPYRAFAKRLFDEIFHEGRIMKKYLITIISFIFLINSTAYSYECDNSTIGNIYSLENFYEFSNIFINNQSLQIIFSRNYIIISFVDINTYAIPKKIEKIINKKNINFPIIPSYKIINESEQKLEIVQIDDENAEIIRSKDDTGLLIKYHFKKNKCWNLYMIEDDSI